MTSNGHRAAIRKYYLLFGLAATAVAMAACGDDESATWAGPEGAGGATGDASTDVVSDGAKGGAAGTAGTAGGAGTGDAGTAGSATGGTSGAAGGIPDASIDVVPEVSFEYDAPLFDNSVSADSACAATTAAAELTPLEMYIMQDRSGSMAYYGQEDCNVGSSETWKWCFAINALDGYFQDPGSWSNWVALQYFPISGQSCTGNGGACATPSVARGVLDDAQRTTLRNSLNATVPNGSNTPTEAALRGIAAYTAQVQPQAQAMGHTLIGILITDGIPEGSCNNDASHLKSIVQNHLNATGIRTFVIGMTGADFGVLETIASGGGVQPHGDFCNSGAQCTYYSVGNGNPAVFIEVLKKIQQTAIGCTYKVPVPEAGIIDYAKVKVEYQPGNGDPAQQFDSVPDASQCAPGKWYYDDNNAPTTVTLCPDACTLVKADNQAKVTLLLGCLGS